jgi:hypothetical protein
MIGAVEFRVDTASWTDPTLVNSDEGRLWFYAERSPRIPLSELGSRRTGCRQRPKGPLCTDWLRRYGSREESASIHFDPV